MTTLVVRIMDGSSEGGSSELDCDDADREVGPRRLVAAAVQQGLVQRLEHAGPVEVPGQLVEVRQLFEMRLVLLAPVDRPQHAQQAQGLAARVELGEAPVVYPAEAPVRLPDPVLAVEHLAHAVMVGQTLQTVRQVLGIDPAVEAVAVTEGSDVLALEQAFDGPDPADAIRRQIDRKSTRLNSSH